MLILARLGGSSVYHFGSPNGVISTPQAAIEEIERGSRLGDTILHSHRKFVAWLLEEVSRPAGTSM